MSVLAATPPAKTRRPESPRLRVLAFAYACEPGEGSEPGAGWMWARMLARLGETWVITRANNRIPIEAALPTVPERDRLRFVYVDLPPWARSWKRGGRGLRMYYVLWQLAALARARRLAPEHRFDLVWHVTLANAWIGSLAGLTGPPFVYGPVGGGVSPPWRLVPALGVRGLGYELVRALARLAGRYLNPSARLAWRRSTLILAQNEETRAWLPTRHRGKVRVFPNVVLAERASVDRPPVTRTALFVGRLLPWKGGTLALRALVDAPSWRMLVCGAGPEERRLRRLARRCGVEQRVSFLGRRPREEVLRLMCEDADLLLLPSLHEDAGWVAAEAAQAGMTVVCLDRGGPPLVAGDAVSAIDWRGSPSAVATRLAGALEQSERNPAPDRAGDQWLLDARAEALWRHVDESLLSLAPGRGSKP